MAQICNGLFDTGVGTGFGAGAATSTRQTVLPIVTVKELMLRFHPGELLEERRGEDIVDSTL
jgi:hypothetical protein